MRIYRRIALVSCAAILTFSLVGLSMRSKAGLVVATIPTVQQTPKVVSLIIFRPPVEIQTGVWLVRLYGVSNIPGEPGVIVYVPCTPSASTRSAPTPAESGHFGCEMQRLTFGPDRGRYVDHQADIVTPPQGAAGNP